MSKIILNEKQFKDYMRLVLEKQRSQDYLKEVMNETLKNKMIKN